MSGIISRVKRVHGMFSLETALTVIYLTVIGHENNKPTCLFSSGLNIITAAGLTRTVTPLKKPTTGHRRKPQSILLLQSVY